MKSCPHSPARLAAAAAALLSLALPAPVEAAPSPEAEVDPRIEAEVRRWEYVVLLRVASQFGSPLGRAETEALRAGGAVLESVRHEIGPQHSDYRLLVRTRDPRAIDDVLRAMRGVPGVLGASTVQLPETPTYAGGPEFISSYTGDLDPVPGDPRVVVRHEVPPVLDKRDLLENLPLPAGPTVGNTGTGGLTLNVSELFHRMKESHWRKREQRMKDAHLPILPSESASDGSSDRGR